MHNKEKRYKNLSERVIMQLAESEQYKIEGDHEKALKIVRRILKKDPGCLAAAEEVADNLVSLEEFEEAEKVAQFVVAQDSESAVGNYVLGFLLLTEGDNASALPYLQKANIESPNNPEILRCLGWALFHCVNKLQGMVTLERALNMRSDDPLILCDLGVCLLHEHVFEKAIQLFERALALEPDNMRALDCLDAAVSLQEKSSALDTFSGQVSPDGIAENNSSLSHPSSV